MRQTRPDCTKSTQYKTQHKATKDRRQDKRRQDRSNELRDEIIAYQINRIKRRARQGRARQDTEHNYNTRWKVMQQRR
jgi:hypothetical protein